MAGGIDWFRWHHGSVTDPKFQLVARKAGVGLPVVLAVWAFVLEKASAADSRGTFGEIDCESVDCLFGIDEGKTQAVLEQMQSRGLLADGSVCAWDKRQPKRERDADSSTERTRAYRERQAQQRDANEKHVTPGDATEHQGTPREEKRREEGKPTSSLRSEGAESAEQKSAPPSANETEDSLLAAIFEVGLPVMRDGGCSEKSARSLLGKLRKELGDLEALVAVEAMGREKPLDAAAWVAATIKSRQTAAVSLGEFMAGCRERKEPVVSGYAPIFEYAEQAGIPGEFVELAWGEFKRRHMPGGIWERARREDWRRSFLAALQTNALRLWYFDAKTQSFLLTTVGMQADIAGRAAA